jgi:hypothetical protein
VKTSSSWAFAAVLSVTAPDPPPVTLHAEQEPPVPSVNVTPPPVASWLMSTTYCPHFTSPVAVNVVVDECVVVSTPPAHAELAATNVVVPLAL